MGNTGKGMLYLCLEITSVIVSSFSIKQDTFLCQHSPRTWCIFQSLQNITSKQLLGLLCLPVLFLCCCRFSFFCIHLSVCKAYNESFGLAFESRMYIKYVTHDELDTFITCNIMRCRISFQTRLDPV